MSGDLQLLLSVQALGLLLVENALSRMWPLYGPFRKAVPFPEVWQLHCRQGYRNSKGISMVISWFYIRPPTLGTAPTR